MPGLEPAGEDHQRAGDQAEREPVEEDRGALADAVGEGEQRATSADHGRDPGWRNNPPNAWVR